MVKAVKYFFGIDNVVKPENAVGKLPTTKEAYKTNFKLAWPSALEGILVSLIAAVDVIMVGSLGAGAIAAVGITTQPKFIALAFIRSLNVGVTALVARRRGEKNTEETNLCLKNGIIMSFIISVAVSAICFFNARGILLLAGAKSDIIDAATAYFKIISVGNLFFGLSMTINAAQIGVGNTKISMQTNIAANVLNLIMNYFLINGIWLFPRLEVVGAAVATAMGNILAFLISVYSVCKKDGILNILAEKNWRLKKRILKGFSNVGTSAFAEQAFTRIGLFAYARLVADLGTIAVAGNQIGMNILSLSFSCGEGLGNASASLVGQNLGAKRPDLAKIYGKVGQRTALLMSLAVAGFFIIGQHSIFGLFTDDSDVLYISRYIMNIIAVATIAQMSYLVFSGCLRGAGDTLFVAVLSLVSIGLLRPISSWFFCYPLGLGLTGAWIGLLFDQFLRLLLAWLRFRSSKWTKISI